MKILPSPILLSRILPPACIVIALALAYSFSPRTPVPPRNVGATDAAQKVAAAPKDVAIDASTSIHVLPVVEEDLPPAIAATDAPPAGPNLSYLAYYAYSEVPPDTPPAEIIMDSMKDIPVGTPIEEIKRASRALGLDFTYMKAVARIESDFQPTARTGSYIGLFQLSHYEFDKYGYWDILSPRDNAIAAAYKFTTAAILFEIRTHKKATLSDLYLIHQQGTQGAAEHVSHPERIAWESMCATDEGRMKGEKWCKRAIWQNTLPDIKKEWKKVENLTSGAFVKMWQDRVAQMYARYSETVADKQDSPVP